MADNKVEVNGVVLIDLTQDTVTPQTMLSGVTAHDKSGQIIDGEVVRRTDSGNTTLDDTTVSKSYPSGYYPNSHGAVHSTVDIPNPNITVSASGLITASASWTKGFTSDSNYSNTKQLTTKGATTLTPNNTTQTAISSGTYATGDIKVNPVPTETKVAKENGTITPSSGKFLSSVSVEVPIQHYYTGNSYPSSSLGVDGDIYLYE